MTQIRPTIVIFLALTIVTGLVYPAIVTGIAQVAFSHASANGSVIESTERRSARSLIGQAFDEPTLLLEPAVGDVAGPVQCRRVERIESWVRQTRPCTTRSAIGSPRCERPIRAIRQPVPIDLVTASASGLDPHISPAAAAYQVGRVARARGLTESRVEQLGGRSDRAAHVGRSSASRGSTCLQLNLSLDRDSPK